MKQKVNTFTEEINNAIAVIIPQSPLATNLEESMSYSLEAGGKRIRPVLLLLTLDMLTSNHEQGLSPALALEMIHTYSLIHDDLPPMDNDDYRRGKLTNHKVYGEWKAILAGDALLTKAFDVVSHDETLSDSVKLKLIQRLSQASGHLGMVGGQTLDMQSENQEIQIDLATLEQIHRTKTGALITFAVMAASDIAQVENHVADALYEYSDHIGLMFQIKDDLLDIYGDEEKLGKSVGSDLENHKSTYVSLLGLDGAEEKLQHHTDAAYDCLAQIEQQYDTSNLKYIIELFVNRDH
ncbi:polyprenyl synthetase family protein [Staphylococcus arlettae]|uniref:polyprenyl synthetase family protein n=1 Tax=Staphylococcus arlettae TaxID=29378 RepID=UPI001E56022E|nr:farnesyl diphosphate synthase [Staphylococcus arlettae]MCD8906430.1 polyprenyl synthetase family protein [Staphylococcus arlettae]MEB6065332.1 polyprenyl synthetase family protein [Staphylococcus arlettae]